MIVEPGGVRLTEAERLVLSAASDGWSLGELLAAHAARRGRLHIAAERDGDLSGEAMVGALVVILSAGLAVVSRDGPGAGREERGVGTTVPLDLVEATGLGGCFGFWLSLTALGREVVGGCSTEAAS